MLDYHYEIGSFNGKEIPLSLCKQLMELIDTLYKWAEKGKKGANETPFTLYVSETELEGTFFILKQQGKATCLVKLFTINNLSTNDELFCRETEKWLLSNAKCATLISGTSKKERVKFFDTQQQKVQSLIEKIESSVI